MRMGGRGRGERTEEEHDQGRETEKNETLGGLGEGVDKGSLRDSLSHQSIKIEGPVPVPANPQDAHL